jgi:hypothetical protein
MVGQLVFFFPLLSATSARVLASHLLARLLEIRNARSQKVRLGISFFVSTLRFIEIYCILKSPLPVAKLQL